MSQSKEAEAHLALHYEGLVDLKADFRNYNLFTLVAGMVEGRSVVEIGSGLGFFAAMLGERGKEVVGIEPSAEIRALASRINPSVRMIAGTAEELPTLVHEPVDTIVMLDVLEHIEDDVAQVDKIRDALRPGGSFVVVVPAYQALYGERDRLMGHYRRYTARSLRRLLESRGFSMVRLRYWNVIGTLPYWVAERVLRRPLEAPLRHAGEKEPVKRLAQQALSSWFHFIENPISFGFGLSIIAVATKS